MREIGLYIHIPFCHSICSYCDFTKMVASPKTKKNYLKSLIKEIELRKKIFDTHIIKSIYIGGGTPSSLKVDDLNLLLEAVENNIDLTNVLEYTIEANPEDINLDFVKCISTHHINRISIGVQSFNSTSLNTMKRTSDVDDIFQKMTLLRCYGIDNINLDFMFGIEPASINSTIDDLQKFIDLKPTHLSCYSLILEPRTLLFHQSNLGQFKVMNEDKEAAIYQAIVKKLIDAGFNQYEISNFSSNGYQSLHNLIYWSNERYLGVGLGSSSYLGHVRFKTTHNLQLYEKMINENNIDDSAFYDEIEELTKEDEEIYEIIMRLRLTEGIVLPTFFDKFQTDFFDAFSNIRKLLNEDICIYDKNKQTISIAPKYTYVTNQIIKKLID